MTTPRTRVQQSQISRTKTVSDSLPLPPYSDVDTLEGDLNYLRSVIRELKGTNTYDTPLLITLSELEQNLTGLLDGATLNDIHLSGEPTAENPQPGENSNRVATTSFVQSVVAASGAAGDKFLKVEKGDPAILEWTINHGMGKRPSVTFVDSSKNERVVGVEYIDDNSLTLHFTYQVSGKAYLN